MVSGVYYVKAPENCGVIKINDPRTGAEMVSPKLRERCNHLTRCQKDCGERLLICQWLVDVLCFLLGLALC